MGASAETHPISRTVGVAMLLIVPPVANAIGGLGVGQALVFELEGLGMRWDDRYDPVIVQDGVVTAGPRIVHETLDGRTILIDPEETVAREAVTAPEALIVRRTTVEHVRPLGTQTSTVPEFMAALGVSSLTLDSAHIQAWLTEHRAALVLATVAGFAALGVVDWVLLALYALAATRIAMMRVAGRTFGVVFPVALALTAPLVILRWALWGLGLPLGCAGLFFWPIVLSGLTHALMSRWENPVEEDD